MLEAWEKGAWSCAEACKDKQRSVSGEIGRTKE